VAEAVVLCTQAMHPAGRALLAPYARLLVPDSPAPEDLRSLLSVADYLVVRNHLASDFLDAPHHLRGIVRHGTGLDMIPMDAATRQGIPVANVPGANAQAVAEYVVGSFFNLARRQAEMNHVLRASGWAAARGPAAASVELAGRTVGIVGLGDIGTRIARICSAGLGMQVLGYQPDPSRFPPFVQSVALDTLLGESDFVTLNCPLTDGTRALIDASKLALMKPTAFLVNAARGEIVDEPGLARALAGKAIAGAAIDVYATQPLRREHPFLELDNVILTPHVAALTQESSLAMSLGAAEQVLQLMRGERPRHLVNAQVWPAWPHREEILERGTK
jgi:D-3-phosphoglycerate dehydrogenase